MSQSKRAHEGYLLIDNSQGGFGAKEEFATITCSHCNRVVVLNTLRTRARAYCQKCDHYICDGCGTIAASTMECAPLKAVLDRRQEEAFLREQGGNP